VHCRKFVRVKIANSFRDLAESCKLIETSKNSSRRFHWHLTQFDVYNNISKTKRRLRLHTSGLGGPPPPVTPTQSQRVTPLKTPDSAASTSQNPSPQANRPTTAARVNTASSSESRNSPASFTTRPPAPHRPCYPKVHRMKERRTRLSK
jgi:hypothetical protein